MYSTTLFVFLFTSISGVSSEYICVCSHHTQRGIYGSPSLGSPPLGFLYKDECKAEVAVSNLDNKWAAVQFFHMIAYIEKDSEIDITLCQGKIPDEDNVSTMIPPTTQQPGKTSTFKPTHSVTTGKLTYSTTHMSPSPTTSVQKTSKSSVASYSTIHHTKPTTQTSTHVTQPSTTHHHVTAQHHVTTQHHVTVISTAAPFSIGQLQLCPDNVRRGAYINGFKLGQSHHSCYEICNQALSWYHANDICKARNGHLASLSSIQENQFLQNLIRHYYHNKVFWIGLNDLHHEEHFTWSSGEHVSYKNWNQGRKSSSHGHEDCVVMLNNGHWDDRNCGSPYINEPFFTHYPYVCEYAIHEGGVLVG